MIDVLIFVEAWLAIMFIVLAIVSPRLREEFVRDIGLDFDEDEVTYIDLDDDEYDIY